MIYNTNIIPLIDIQDTNLVFTEILLNGMPFDSNQVIDLDGNYILFVYARDKVGNEVSKEIVS